jgi:hypothetical protein
MQTTPINWHESPIAQRLIARLTPQNTERATRISIPADFYELTGTDRWGSEVLLALAYVREASIDEAVGYSFYDVCEKHNWHQGKANAWQEAQRRAPSVTQVVEDAFAARRALQVAA